MSKQIKEIIVSLVTAAVVSLATMAYAYGNRITALETSQGFIKDTLIEIKADVKTIRERGE